LRILVTGGAGFIGSNFIRYFLSVHPDSQVINFDKLTYAGNLDNLADLSSHPQYEFVKGDICDAGQLNEVLGSTLDAVVHFAAESHVDRSIADPGQFIQANIHGTYTLIEAARRRQLPRFVHVSTDEVYGSLAPGESADEQFSLRPNSPYAASKAASDLLVRSYCRTFGFPGIITRCSNNYGPYQFPEKLLPLMITNAFEGRNLPVYGDGLNERDWIFVEDHCHALDCVLQSGREGEVYNIGGGEPISNLEIVRRLLAVVGASEGLIEFVIDRPGHDRRYAINSRKITEELQWRPKVGLAEGLARTVNWYRGNPEWVRKTKSGEYRTYYDRYYVNRGSSLAQL
jgi:dTDP-glucose 4,6-dehydratase